MVWWKKIGKIEWLCKTDQKDVHKASYCCCTYWKVALTTIQCHFFTKWEITPLGTICHESRLLVYSYLLHTPEHQTTKARRERWAQAIQARYYCRDPCDSRVPGQLQWRITGITRRFVGWAQFMCCAHGVVHLSNVNLIWFDDKIIHPWLLHSAFFGILVSSLDVWASRPQFCDAKVVVHISVGTEEKRISCCDPSNGNVEPPQGMAYLDRIQEI